MPVKLNLCDKYRDKCIAENRSSIIVSEGGAI